MRHNKQQKNFGTFFFQVLDSEAPGLWPLTAFFSTLSFVVHLIYFSGQKAHCVNSQKLGRCHGCSIALQDYETCVKRGDKECTYNDGDERDDFGQLTEFFCGQDDECT